MLTGATIQGRLFARNGQVTLRHQRDHAAHLRDSAAGHQHAEPDTVVERDRVSLSHLHQ